jgi:hypothetical protein
MAPAADAYLAGANVALQERGPSSARLAIGLLPEQCPLQPTNTYPESGEACRRMVMGPGMVTAQRSPVDPHTMPDALTTPLEGRAIFSVYGGPIAGALSPVVGVVDDGVVGVVDDGVVGSALKMAPHDFTPFSWRV